MADLSWWQRGAVYQLWLRSFFDTDGDGNGDLEGLIAKLDYLTWLGVDVVWLDRCPLFAPMRMHAWFGELRAIVEARAGEIRDEMSR